MLLVRCVRSLLLFAGKIWPLGWTRIRPGPKVQSWRKPIVTADRFLYLHRFHVACVVVDFCCTHCMFQGSSDPKTSVCRDALKLTSRSRRCFVQDSTQHQSASVLFLCSCSVSDRVTKSLWLLRAHRRLTQFRTCTVEG